MYLPTRTRAYHPVGDLPSPRAVGVIALVALGAWLVFAPRERRR